MGTMISPTSTNTALDSALCLSGAGAAAAALSPSAGAFRKKNHAPAPPPPSRSSSGNRMKRSFFIGRRHCRLVRPDHIEDLLAIARLLDVGDLAAAAVGDAGLGDLVVCDAVGG